MHTRYNTWVCQKKSRGLSMNLIKVTTEEWEKAELYFQNNPSAVKFSKKETKNQNAHSFIKVNNEIYAIASRHIAGEEKHSFLGEGAFGKVRVVQTKKGENFAVKIEGRGLRQEDNAEAKIMKIMNYLKGEAARKLDKQKQFLGSSITEKLYTVTQLRKGGELWDGVFFQDERNIKRNKPLGEGQLLLILIESARATQALHDKRIVHADIKEQNFMMDIKGHRIIVESIDYGHSFIIPENLEEISFEGHKGTPRRQSVEALKGRGTFSIDIHALGVMFKNIIEHNEYLSNHLELKELLDLMTSNNYESGRLSIKDVLEQLISLYKPIKKQIDDSNKILLEACKAENFTIENVENIITGLDFKKDSICMANENGVTLLHLACESNNLELVTLLLKNGAENIADNLGVTPLEKLNNQHPNHEKIRIAFDEFLIKNPEKKVASVNDDNEDRISLDPSSEQTPKVLLFSSKAMGQVVENKDSNSKNSSHPKV
jgi:serine/threonine protein kinase